MAYQNIISTNDPSSDSKWMLQYHMGKMIDAEGSKDWWRFWVEFKFVLERMLAYMEPETRRKIDEDRRELEKYVYAIQKQTGLDQKAKDNEIEKLRLNFIESHRAYTGLYLAKTGLIQVEEVGELNFEKHDFKLLSRIIRAGAEPAEIERTADNYLEQKKEAEANGDTTTTEQSGDTTK